MAKVKNLDSAFATAFRGVTHRAAFDNWYAAEHNVVTEHDIIGGHDLS